MNKSLFNDASPTNLHVVTSPISTCSCFWIQTSLTCAPAQVVVFHLLHTDRMYTVSEKVHPWLLTVSCCNLSTILLIIPLNTVRLSSTIIHIVVIVRLSRRIIAESWLFLPVIVASAKTPLKYDCSFPLILFRTRLNFW